MKKKVFFVGCGGHAGEVLARHSANEIPVWKIVPRCHMDDLVGYVLPETGLAHQRLTGDTGVELVIVPHHLHGIVLVLNEGPTEFLQLADVPPIILYRLLIQADFDARIILGNAQKAFFGHQNIGQSLCGIVVAAIQEKRLIIHSVCQHHPQNIIQDIQSVQYVCHGLVSAGVVSDQVLDFQTTDGTTLVGKHAQQRFIVCGHIQQYGWITFSLRLPDGCTDGILHFGRAGFEFVRGRTSFACVGLTAHVGFAYDGRFAFLKEGGHIA